MMIGSARERDILRVCGAKLAAITAELVASVHPGMATIELNRIAEKRIREAGGTAVFKGYRTEPKDPPYPASICVSVNHEVVHGIPAEERILRDGDIFSIDIGMRWPGGQETGSKKQEAGLITDMAVSVGVGDISDAAARLIRATREALDQGIAVLRPGIRMGDLGFAIQKHIESFRFGVVRVLAGHGVGQELHEDPYVPNYGKPGEGIVLKEGMVLAIEPMATLGDPKVRLAKDGWTWETKDGSLVAHWEHTVVITKAGADVLTQGGPNS